MCANRGAMCSRLKRMKMRAHKCGYLCNILVSKLEQRFKGGIAAELGAGK